MEDCCAGVLHTEVVGPGFLFFGCGSFEGFGYFDARGERSDGVVAAWWFGGGHGCGAVALAWGCFYLGLVLQEVREILVCLVAGLDYVGVPSQSSRIAAP